MHRFFVAAQDIRQKHQQFESQDKNLCHQLTKVLKLRSGKESLLCDNTGFVHHVQWSIVSKSLCKARLLSSQKKEDISQAHRLHLFVSPLKNQNRWEWILEKGTELGVASFTPLICTRSEAQLLRKPERLQRIITEAAEQSGRTLLPLLHEAKTLKSIDIKDNQYGIMARVGSHPLLLNFLQSSSVATDKETLVFIGPEGGFTDEEEAFCKNQSLHAVSLGKQILRTETAAITCSGLIMSSFLKLQ